MCETDVEKGHVRVKVGGNEIMVSTCDTSHTSSSISLTRSTRTAELAQ
jgi:hypothetical protein